jgi:hypothetical protein
MRVKFLQTADPFRYAAMLAASSASTRAFCDANKHEYEAFVGLKYGTRPEHATYNRIALLNEALNSGYDGWLVYLDADSFVVDLQFDLNAYLRRYQDHALIVRPSIPGEALAWRINAGVLLINASHPATKRILRGWRRLFRLAYLFGQLHISPEYSIVNDQNLLQAYLYFNPRLRQVIHYEDPALINGADATFIAQYLTSDIPDLEMRVAMISARVARAFMEADVDARAYLAN